MFYNGMFLDDGTFTMDYSDYTVPSFGNSISFTYQSSDGTSRFYYGYLNIDTLFNKLVVANLENFTYETSIE